MEKTKSIKYHCDTCGKNAFPVAFPKNCKSKCIKCTSKYKMKIRNQSLENIMKARECSRLSMEYIRDPLTSVRFLFNGYNEKKLIKT